MKFVLAAGRKPARLLDFRADLGTKSETWEFN